MTPGEASGGTSREQEAVYGRPRRGVDMYRKVYGDSAITMEAGASDFFDLMMEPSGTSPAFNSRSTPGS